MTKEQYESLPVQALRELAKSRGVKRTSAMKKSQLIEAMLELDSVSGDGAASDPAPELTVSEPTAPILKQEPLSPEFHEKVREAFAAPEPAPVEDDYALPDMNELDNVPVEESSGGSSSDSAAEPMSASSERQLRERSFSAGGDTRGRSMRDSSGTFRSGASGEGISRENRGAGQNRKENEFASVGEPTRGVLEIMQDGSFGFLRSENYLQGDSDVYVSLSQIRRFNLKTGDMVSGNKRPANAVGQKSALLYVSAVNDQDPEEARRRSVFETMTPIFPNRRIRLERKDGSGATRIVDLISPIGKGQRGMIVSPPKAGKTTLLKDIAKSILISEPEAYLIILLIDERPEEVTDMRETVSGDRVEIIYSTFDEMPDHHARVAEMVLQRAKRLVEMHQDVIILLDSITRLARAYNVLVPPSGRTLSGGLDPTALYTPKRFFGAARNMREGGSLTILATALVDTGSKMDDMIYEEFKGTGNMELILDRKLQEKRIFPAIDIVKSGTRRDDLLLTTKEQAAVERIRRRINGIKGEESVELILNAVAKYPENAQVVNAVLTKWQA